MAGLTSVTDKKLDTTSDSNKTTLSDNILKRFSTIANGAATNVIKGKLINRVKITKNWIPSK